MSRNLPHPVGGTQPPPLLLFSEPSYDSESSMTEQW